jgi:serine/threonine protein kinase
LEPNTNKFTKTAIVYKGASNYKLQSKLGEGAVGEVFRVVHKQTQELYALKRVSKISATMVSTYYFFIMRHQILNFQLKSLRICPLLSKIFVFFSECSPFLDLLERASKRNKQREIGPYQA